MLRHTCPPKVRWDFLAKATILGVAAAMRLAALDRVPPGLQHDEVFSVVFAAEVRAGHWPVFFDHNGGNEPLFLYLVTGALRAFGENLLAFRWPAAAGGLLGVAALSWAGGVLLGRSEAIAAAFLLATSFWHVLDSRFGLRAIWLPTLLTLAYGFFWRWQERGHVSRGVLGVLFLAASLYTYSAAPLGVLALGAFLALGLCMQEPVVRRNWWKWSAAIVGAAVLAAPMYLHMAQVPQATERIRALSYELTALRHGNPFPVLRNALKVVTMFGLLGDPEWRYNIAGRPVFLPLSAICFYVGAAACLLRAKRSRPHMLLGCWLLTNLLASVVTGSAPSTLRAVGAAPAACLCAAMGAKAICKALERRLRVPQLVAFGLLAGGFVIEAGISAYQYFALWPTNPHVREIYRADLAAVARYLAHSQVGDQVLVSAQFAADLDRQSFEYLGFWRGQARWFDGQLSLVLPAEPALVFLPSFRPLARELEQMALSSGLVAVADQASYKVLRWPGRSWTGSEVLATIDTPWPGQGIQLLSVAYPREVPAGEQLCILLRWRVTAPAPGGRYVAFFANLRDERGFIWGQAHSLAYPTADWRVGDHSYQVLRVQVPADMPPGKASICVGVQELGGSPMNLARLPDGLSFWCAEGPAVQVHKAAGEELPIDPEQPLAVRFGSWELLGASVSPRVAQAGETIEVSLWWRCGGASERPSLRYVLQRDGVRIEVASKVAFAGLANPQGLLRDRAAVRFPVDAAAGLWELRVKSAGPGAEASLGQVFVSQPEREFAAPHGVRPVRANWGWVELYGFRLEPTRWRRGESVSVNLFWRSLAQWDEPITVFVHLVKGDGTVAVAADSLPAGGRRPACTWMPGEFIADEHRIELSTGLAPGQYELKVGLYRADIPGYPRLRLARAGAGGAEDAVTLQEVTIE